MKRTDLQKRERELKRSKKKEERIDKTGEKKEDKSIGDYIKELTALFYHDGKRIYNISDSIEILELLEEMKGSVDSGQWDNIIRKSVKATGISAKEPAVKDLKALLGE